LAQVVPVAVGCRSGGQQATMLVAGHLYSYIRIIPA